MNDEQWLELAKGQFRFSDNPTEKQLNDKVQELKDAETNARIDATRRSQYGSWESQMEMIYKDQKNGTSTFKDHCDKVRSDNPKG